VKESCGVRVRLIFGVSLMRMIDEDEDDDDDHDDDDDDEHDHDHFEPLVASTKFERLLSNTSQRAAGI